MSTSELSGRLTKVSSDLEALKSTTYKQSVHIISLLEELKERLNNEQVKESKQIVTALLSHIEYLKGYSS